MFSGEFWDRTEAIDVKEEEADIESSGPYRWNCQMKSFGAHCQSSAMRDHQVLLT
jgi:hypothetical protein